MKSGMWAWAAGVAFGCCVQTVQAQTAYPVKPVRIIVPYTAGGSADFMARIIAQRMTEAWKEQVLVENRGNDRSRSKRKCGGQGQVLARRQP